MKELSIEEKARNYDEAYKKVAVRFGSNVADEIFLKESEDERMVKFIKKQLFNIKKTITDNYELDTELTKAIDWLEKQGKNNMGISEATKKKLEDNLNKALEKETAESFNEFLDEQGEQKPVDFSDLRTWKYIVDAVLTEKEGIGQYLDSPFTEEVAKKLQKRFGNIEQKPTDTDNKFIRMRETKPKDSFEFLDRLTTKVEPKFHEGDWVAINSELRLTSPICIKDIDYNNYRVESVDGDSGAPTIDCLDNHYHLWTIEDAKAGDVLVRQNGEMPFIFKERKDNHIYCYCGYTNRKDIFFDRFVNSEGEELHWLNLYHEYVYPATKEQCDLLFEKMKEAGYKWDAEKKELKKIEQKPAEWSKEDEDILNTIINHFKVDIECTDEDDTVRWLKSLKDRVQLQPKQEWSEEDETRITNIIIMLKEDASLHFNKKDITKAVDWLKSLRPQNTWKPSDEQMEVLLSEVTGWTKGCPKQIVLESLYQDLKKLKG